MGGELARPYRLALLAEAYGKGGQIEKGLAVLGEALKGVDALGERWWATELYRLQGELTLQQSRARLGHVQSQAQPSPNKSEVPNVPPPTPGPQTEAEACFRKAIEIACKQQAKSLQLRATTSLARLWQQQGKQVEARELLAPVYEWFTEGFDTADLKDAKTLLDKLSQGD